MLRTQSIKPFELSIGSFGSASPFLDVKRSGYKLADALAAASNALGIPRSASENPTFAYGRSASVPSGR